MSPRWMRLRQIVPARLSGRMRLLLAAEAIVGLSIARGLLDADPGAALLAARIAAVVALVLVAMALTVRTGSGSRRQLGAAGVLGLLLGIVGVVAGAIAGVAGLLVAGPAPASVFGLLVFVSGLGLSVAAVAWLWRGVPRWWRLLGVPVAYLVLQFWMLPVTMAVLGTHGPRLAFDGTMPAGAQRVTFAAGDATPLVGWYTPSTNGAAVIVLAGAGGTKADTLAHAAVLSKHGYGVLALDLRGSGESGGQTMLWGWGAEQDVSAAIDFLATRTDVDPGRIAVLGLSMGGEVAIASRQDSRVRSVVAEGATGRACPDLTFLGSDLEGTIHRADSCLGWFLAGLVSRESEPGALASVVTATKDRPLLLVAADLPAEHAATEAWRALSPGTIELWEPVGASHTGALIADPAEWERRVVDFLDRTLR